MNEVQTHGLRPNKTTLYRQLETLVKHDVVDVVILGPKVQLFELKKGHHHHFVCSTCKDVLDLESESVESAFQQFEQQLRQEGFTVQKHELTFFGACASCS